LPHVGLACRSVITCCATVAATRWGCLGADDTTWSRPAYPAASKRGFQ
jgi:hypothetical protein